MPCRWASSPSWSSRRPGRCCGRSGRAIRWARANPWRFAVAPGVAAAAIVIAVSVVLGGGIVGPVFAGLWHGAVAFGLTGAVGTYARSRANRPSA